MKKTNEAELVERFRKLEAELVEVLKIEGISFDDETKKQSVKSQLKAYIKKVEKARKVFDEYESVAKEIEKIAAAEGKKGSTSAEISEEVVNLREDEIVLGDEAYLDKLELVDGKTVTVKKKKKTSGAKEF